MKNKIYEIPVRKIDGAETNLGEYKNKVLLVVNVAETKIGGRVLTSFSVRARQLKKAKKDISKMLRSIKTVVIQKLLSSAPTKARETKKRWLTPLNAFAESPCSMKPTAAKIFWKSRTEKILCSVCVLSQSLTALRRI